MTQPKTLAWHETLELGELVTFQSVGLLKLKKHYSDVKDPELKRLYLQSIQALEKNLNQLLPFYRKAPSVRDEESIESELYADSRKFDDTFYGADLLLLVKTGVRNYAHAITETATASLRSTFVTHLNEMITLHYRVFEYLNAKGNYPAYDLEKLMESDKEFAKRALRQKY